MAKKKTTKKGGLFSFFSKKKKTTRGRSKKNQPSISSGVKVAASIIVISILAFGGAIGLYYMDRGVKHQQQAQSVNIQICGNSSEDTWLQQEQTWVNTIYKATGEVSSLPAEGIAKTVQQRLAPIPWLHDTKVEVIPQEDKQLLVKITSGIRRPVGLIDLGRDRKYLLAKDMTVLEYLPVSSIPVIEITGIESVKSIPEPGRIWHAEDGAAAVQILDYLYRCDLAYMDEGHTQKPLLDEIVSIDVSNFDARKSSSPDRAHIYLKVKDGTQVKWGAAIGKESVNFEAKTDIKRKRLYQHFVDHNNSLQGSAKYIELRQL